MIFKENKNILIWSSSDIDELIKELKLHNYSVRGVFGCKSKSVSLSGGISEIKEMVDRSVYSPALCIKEVENLIFSKFFENYSRLERSVKKKSFGYSAHLQTHERFEYYKNRLALYTAFFSSIIDDMRIHSVWFFRPPHIGIDNVLYEVCQAKKIDIIVTWQSLFPDKFFYGKTINELFLRKKHCWFKSDVEQDKGRPNLFYMKKNKTTAKEFLKNSKMIVMNFLRGSKGKINVKLLVGYKLLKMEKERRYKKEKKKLCYMIPEGNFIYFPLHLQPEATTSILGQKYSDQVDAIEELSLRCPNGWNILLKENPKQDSNQRPVEFFKRIQGLRNVAWVDPATYSKELIKKSRLVATITGTAGYEAILEEKSCVFFGNPWYQTLPGAIKFHSTIDLKMVAKQAPFTEAVLKSLSELLQTCADGVLYSSGYKNISKMRENERVVVTAKSLIKIDRGFSICEA